MKTEKKTSGRSSKAAGGTCAGQPRAHQHYVLRLYVAGMTPRSQTAIRSVTAICQDYLKDDYELEIIDLYQQPALASGEQIIAAPTLIKKLPAPLRRLIGNMADKDRVLVGLDLRVKDTAT